MPVSVVAYSLAISDDCECLQRCRTILASEMLADVSEFLHDAPSSAVLANQVRDTRWRQSLVHEVGRVGIERSIEVNLHRRSVVRCARRVPTAMSVMMAVVSGARHSMYGNGASSTALRGRPPHDLGVHDLATKDGFEVDRRCSLRNHRTVRVDVTL